MTALTQTLLTPLSRGPLRRVIEVWVGALFVLGVLGVGAAFATTRPVAPLAPGTARLVSGDAAVTVHRGTPVAAADALLRAGDAIVVERGVATLKTAAGFLRARSGSSIVFTSGAPRIARGDVLVQGEEAEVAMRAATATVNGIARVRQGLTLEIGVYEGGAIVRTFAETLAVPRFRRAVVAGAGGPATVSVAPLVVDATDTWDRKFLGRAIELDASLTARSRGLTMQIAAGGSDLLDKVLATAAWRELPGLGHQPIGEVIVAAELARAARMSGDAAASALALRADGADWGLVALEHGVRSLPERFEGLDDAVVPVAPSDGAVRPVTVGPTADLSPSGKPAVTPPTTAPTPNTPLVAVPVEPEDERGVVVGLIGDLGSVLRGLLGG